MVHYTIQEYTEMVNIYNACNGNGCLAARRYAELHPNALRFPDRNVIVRAAWRFNNFGNVLIRNEGGRQRIAPEIEEQVLDEFHAGPRRSTRGVAQQMGIHHSTIHRVLARDEMHPYHFTKVQRLVAGDNQRRLAYCQRLLQENNVNADFVPSVLWTDECTFTRDGMFNFHNYHYWNHENPHLTWDTKSQHRFKLNVWAGLINNQLIGPIFLPEAVNATTYFEFLLKDLPDLMDTLMENWDLNNFYNRHIIYMHDGCPAHTAGTVRDHLTNVFGPNGWIGNNAPVWRWPARSPDLNPCDFYLWGAIKEQVYFDQIETVDELQDNIEAAFASITNDEVIRRATQDVVNRAQKCITAQGGHFEHLPN